MMHQVKQHLRRSEPMATYNNNLNHKLHTYFLERLHLKPYRNNWLKGDCPFCGKEMKFGINLISNKSNCFSCGPHGKALKVIAEVEQLETFHEVIQLIKGLESTDYLVTTPKKVIERAQVQLPESFTLMGLGDSILGRAARSYMKKRGFKIDDLMFKGIGYCTEGDYFGRIILPYYQQGKLVYYTGRTFIDTGEKFKNPRLDALGIGKSQLIYNLDALAIHSHIRIAESIMNCETMGDNCIGIGGKKISEYQFNALIKSPCKMVTILLDPDAATEAYKLALRIEPYKKVRVIGFPVGEDVNSVGRKWVRNREKQTPWQTAQELRKLLREYATEPQYSHF